MKTLYLVRHGKSSWHYPEMDDRERPLKNHGEGDAHLMGKLLRKMDIKAGLMLSSPAKRALETATIFADELRYNQNIRIEEQLYMQGTKAIMEVVANVKNDIDDVFVFSHNPDLLDLLNLISKKEYDNVPTSGVVCVKFAVANWKDVSTSNGEVAFFDYPSKHK